MANPFYIEPANPLAALMAGVQGYDKAQAAYRQNRQDEARLAAAQALQSGSDSKGALAQLLGVGDTQGAATIGSLINQEAARQLQQQQLSESSRHNKAIEGSTAAQLAESGRHNRATESVAAEGLNKPTVIPWGAGIVNRKGEVIREPGGSANLDDNTLTAMAHQYIAGDTSVLQNLGRGAQGAENVVALRKKVAEINAGRGEGGAEQAQRNAEFFGAKSGQRTLGTRSANIELAATEFNQVLPVVQAASKAVDRTNYPNLNSVLQAWQKGTGDKNIVAFAGGVNTLVNLYARAISPSGVPTVSDKDHAREILDKAWSQGQFDAAVGMMKQEIDAALASPERVRSDMRQRFREGQQNYAQPPNAAPTAPAGIPPLPPGFNLVK